MEIRALWSKMKFHVSKINSSMKNLKKNISLLKFFRIDSKKKKYSRERRYLSVIFGYNLEYFNYHFNLKIPYTLNWFSSPDVKVTVHSNHIYNRISANKYL